MIIILYLFLFLWFMGYAYTWASKILVYYIRKKKIYKYLPEIFRKKSIS
jgi:uncharacterized membrane protein SpoIIM required for sporulation